MQLVTGWPEGGSAAERAAFLGRQLRLVGPATAERELPIGDLMPGAAVCVACGCLLNHCLHKPLLTKTKAKEEDAGCLCMERATAEMLTTPDKRANVLAPRQRRRLPGEASLEAVGGG